MKRIVRARLGTALLAAALLSAVASPAAAAGWPWPLGSTVALGFGASWSDAEGRACTHRGVDIAADPGDEVRACVPGTVAFSGPVPSSAGGRVIAVTVRTSGGLDVTYMPLERSCVQGGGEVTDGQTLGTLAPAGDGSSPASHLHLSVKKGDLPIDPTTLLVGRGATAGSAEPGPASEGSAAPAGGAVAGAAAQRVDSEAGSPVYANAGASAPEGSALEVPAAGMAASPAVREQFVSVPLPDCDGRAVHSLDGAWRPRVAVPDLHALALGQPILATGVTLLVGLASAAGLWVRALRGPALAPVHETGRRS